MRRYWSTQYGNLWIKNARTFGFVGIANFNYSIPFSSQKHSEMTTGLLFPFYKPGLIQAGLSNNGVFQSHYRQGHVLVITVGQASPLRMRGCINTTLAPSAHHPLLLPNWNVGKKSDMISERPCSLVYS